MDRADGETKPAQHRPRMQICPLTPNSTKPRTPPIAIPDKHSWNRHQEKVGSVPAHSTPGHMPGTLSGHVQQLLMTAKVFWVYTVQNGSHEPRGTTERLKCGRVTVMGCIYMLKS